MTPVSEGFSATNAAGATTRVRFDLTALVPAAQCGTLVARIRNGATGPTAQCVCRIMVARKQTTMPAEGAEGTTADGWIVIDKFSGGVLANAFTPWMFSFGPEIAYVQVEFSGNAGQAVGVDAAMHAAG